MSVNNTPAPLTSFSAARFASLLRPAALIALSVSTLPTDWLFKNDFCLSSSASVYRVGVTLQNDLK
jgi:hypothetical protein